MEVTNPRGFITVDRNIDTFSIYTRKYIAGFTDSPVKLNRYFITKLNRNIKLFHPWKFARGKKTRFSIVFSYFFSRVTTKKIEYVNSKIIISNNAYSKKQTIPSILCHLMFIRAFIFVKIKLETYFLNTKLFAHCYSLCGMRWARRNWYDHAVQALKVGNLKTN